MDNAKIPSPPATHNPVPLSVGRPASQPAGRSTGFADRSAGWLLTGGFEAGAHQHYDGGGPNKKVGVLSWQGSQSESEIINKFNGA